MSKMVKSVDKKTEKGIKIEPETVADGGGKRVKVEKDQESSVEKGKDINDQTQEKESGFTLPAGIYTKTPATLATLVNISKRRRRGAPRPGSRRFFHDNTSRGYGWLLPGWIGEERIMETGRIYRYYYDPSGRLYHGQDEVLGAWADSGLIVLDL